MTCIAGSITDDRVVMGGDYLCTSLEDGSRYEGASKYVGTANWAIGNAGSCRMDRYLYKYRSQHLTKTFKTIEDVYKLTDWIQEELECVLAVAEESTDFVSYPFELMVASKFGLWVVETDLSVYAIKDYAVIGSGSQCGLGVMALNYWKEPQELYPELMEIVSRHNVTVGPKAWWMTFK